MMWGLKRGLMLVLVFLIITALFTGLQGIKSAVADVVEDIEKMRLERLTSEHKVKITPNFRIKYTSHDSNIVDRVAREAEEQYNVITAYLGYRPNDKITLIIYPSKKELEKGLRLPSGDTTLGAFYAGTINILSPNEWGEEGEQAEKGLYIHELTHLLMDEMAGGNYPIWFTEGMALYHEYIFTGFEWGKNYFFNNSPYSLKELTRHFNRLDQVLAYKQSFLLVKSIMEKNGKEEILELFKKLKKGETFEKAFEDTFGYKLEELEKTYKIDMQGLGNTLAY